MKKKDDFPISLLKGLEKALNYLKKEKEVVEESCQLKLVELRKDISEEVAEKCEKSKSKVFQILKKKSTE